MLSRNVPRAFFGIHIQNQILLLMMKCQCICRRFCLNKSNNLIMKKLPYWRFTIYNQISVKRVSTQSCHVSNFKRLLKFVPYLKKASPKRNCGRLQSVSIQRERYQSKSINTNTNSNTNTNTNTNSNTHIPLSVHIYIHRCSYFYCYYIHFRL